MVLATAQKGSSTIAEYFSKMKTLADNMAATSKKLDDEEITSYILAGLDVDFNPVISIVARRTEPVTLDELYTQLVSWEQRMDLLQAGGSGSSTNAATRGGRGGFQRGGGGRRRSGSSGGARGRSHKNGGNGGC